MYKKSMRLEEIIFFGYYVIYVKLAQKHCDDPIPYNALYVMKAKTHFWLLLFTHPQYLKFQ